MPAPGKPTAAFLRPERATGPDEGSRPDKGSRHVAVLIATYNGARFLEQQIETLGNQDVGRIDLWISDDGSSDRTLDILAATKAGWTRGEVHLTEGPRAGFAENFRSLLIRPDIEADHVAFCDQDDLWDDDKLSAAIAWLDAKAAGVPGLHCSRTRIVAEDGAPRGLSPLFARPPDFRNAIVQNIAGGNTMVLNRQAHALMREASRRTAFVAHDWWCYIVMTGSGGKVRYSPEARTAYRQHDDNAVGENNSWLARLVRLRMMTQGRFREWNALHLSALAACEDMLGADARRTVSLFAQARTGNVLARLAGLRRSGVHRQTLPEQIGLYLACALNRL